MSFVFRGTRTDIETGFPGFIPERRAVVYTWHLFAILVLYAVLIL